MEKRPYANPYLMGFVLGLVLLASFYLMGRGLGASSPMARAAAVVVEHVAPGHASHNLYFRKYFDKGVSPLYDWLVFLVVGAGAGGLFSASTYGRLKGEIARGSRIGAGPRLALAFVGGVLSGFAARLARGCTSGQALTGAAQLSVGSWAFMICIFVGAYGAAYFVRKEWQ